MKANYPVTLLIVFLIIATTPGNGHPSQINQTTAVKLFFILEEGKGKFGRMVGCGDSVVPVVVKIAPTTTPLKAAFVQLLAAKDENYCQTGLMNSLHQSSLSVKDVSVNNKTKTAFIKLAGEYKDSGHCDTPRAQAQLVETAKQFPNVKKVRIFVNDKELDFNPTE